MANELRTVLRTGWTTYIVIFDKDDGTVWYPTGEAFEAWGTGSRTANDYAISATEKAAGVGYYMADFPSDMDAGTYDVVWRRQVGSVPADSDPNVAGPLAYEWTGVAVAEEAPSEATATTVCNRALALMGTAGETVERISSIYDGSDAANLCLLLWPGARQRMLIRIEPQEAVGWADLGTEVTVDDMADWDYAFNLPSDCIKLIKQTDEDDRTAEYECKLVGGKLLTNTLSNAAEDSAYIKYVKNLTTIGSFGEPLLNAMVLSLAADVAPGILKGQLGAQRRNQLLDELESLAVKNARAAEGDQQYHELETPDTDNYSWLGGRS